MLKVEYGAVMVRLSQLYHGYGNDKARCEAVLKCMAAVAEIAAGKLTEGEA